MNDNYVTPIEAKQIDFSGLNKLLKLDDLDVEINSSKATVNWVLEVDARAYGIKGVTILATSIDIEISWYVDGESLTAEEKERVVKSGGTEMRNGYIEGEITIDTTRDLPGQEWKIKEEFYFTPSGQISPDELEIDFDKFEITIR